MPSVAARAQDTAPAETPPAPAAAPADTDEGAADKDVLKIRILMAREIREGRLPPLSLLDIPPPDDGIAGAKLAISDNNTTGRFLKQEFILDVVENADPAQLIAEVTKHIDAGVAYVVVDASAETLLKLSDTLKDKDAVLFNASAPDETLREEQCRLNVKHTAPSRTMLADALAQYMAWKQWRNWVLVIGPAPEDKLYADAIRRAAKRFGLKIVEERVFDYDPGSRRADGGFEQVQQQIPSFMQGLPEHDVVVVADEGELFGEYFPYRTWVSRPVIGTAGLFATPWHPAIELWGGTQFQNRFKRLAGRVMRPLDYNAWTAVRSVGEAATRKSSADPKVLIPYMRSPEFELAAFKGQKVTYRAWNGQLRQPILVATAKILVTVSPQPGFLHQLTELDTLGVDRPESKCTAFKN
ncbi:ABC transporter substrate-binding protein [Hyphomicrobium sp.]|uniref:ABC transporter substrate-binding protein n=1 Tax=Hyphomicrobium sp. TaxID=82 RepID=UPI0025C4C2DC|nr:ABC transporter substrate-binding protein [Hyphomicrobium sp.]